MTMSYCQELVEAWIEAKLAFKRDDLDTLAKRLDLDRFWVYQWPLANRLKQIGYPVEGQSDLTISKMVKIIYNADVHLAKRKLLKQQISDGWRTLHGAEQVSAILRFEVATRLYDAHAKPGMVDYKELYQQFPTEPYQLWISLNLRRAMKESLIRQHSRAGGDHRSFFMRCEYDYSR